MLELDLKLMGDRICKARKECGLTQKELAQQTGLAVKTIHDIEKGRKNPTYETLARLLNRLAVSPNSVFFLKAPTPTEEIQYFLETFQSCAPNSQKILLKTVRFLAEQLHTSQDEIN